MRVIRQIVVSWLTVFGLLFAFGYASGYLRYFDSDVLLVWFWAAPASQAVAHFLLRWATPSIRGRAKRAVVAGMNEQGIALALLGLRVSLNEVQEQYGIHTHGLMVQMLRILEAPPDAKKTHILPSRKTAELMVEEIGSLNIKPKKGRGKDLLRIQNLIEALWILFPPQP